MSALYPFAWLYRFRGDERRRGFERLRYALRARTPAVEDAVANRHAGKFGDVWKHLALAEVLRIERPAVYVESHAGDPDYPWTDDAERRFGARMYRRLTTDEPVLAAAAYTGLLDGDRYPGSPRIALSMLPDARLELCDADPSSRAALAAAVGARGRVHAADGPSTAVRFVGRDGAFLFLDPYLPLDAAEGGPSSADVFRAAAGAGTSALLWYGYRWRGRRDAGVVRDDVVRALGTGWTAEVEVRDLDEGAPPLHGGLGGCGLACVNLSATSIEAIRALGAALVGAYEGAPLPSGGAAELRFLADGVRSLPFTPTRSGPT